MPSGRSAQSDGRQTEHITGAAGAAIADGLPSDAPRGSVVGFDSTVRASRIFRAPAARTCQSRAQVPQLVLREGNAYRTYEGNHHRADHPGVHRQADGLIGQDSDAAANEPEAQITEQSVAALTLDDADQPTTNQADDNRHQQ